MPENRRSFKNVDPKNVELLESLAFPVLQASIHHVRSHDHHVYVTGRFNAGDPARGWLWIDDPFVFGMLAAASASGVLVKFFSNSHDPSWGEGAGLFSGIDTLEFDR